MLYDPSNAGRPVGGNVMIYFLPVAYAGFLAWEVMKALRTGWITTFIFGNSYHRNSHAFKYWRAVVAMGLLSSFSLGLPIWILSR
jgi:hypothetical protein